MKMDFETLRAAYHAGALSQAQFVEEVNKLEDVNMKGPMLKPPTIGNGLKNLLESVSLGEKLIDEAKKAKLAETQKKANGGGFYYGMAQGHTTPVLMAQTQQPTWHVGDYCWLGPNGTAIKDPGYGQPFGVIESINPNGSVNVSIISGASVKIVSTTWTGTGTQTSPPPKKEPVVPAQPPAPVIPEFTEIKRPGRKVFKGGQQ